MSLINTRDLHTRGIGLTQSFHAGMGSAHIAVTDNALPRVFPTTLAASFTGEVLVTVGEGAMSAENHAKILTQYAFDRGLPVDVVGREFVEILGRFGRNPLIFRRLIASILGSAERPIEAKRVAMVTPTMVYVELERVLEESNSEVEEIYLHLMADFVCHMIRPFGWVVADNGYSYRLRRPSVFPRYRDVVDMLATRELSRILSQLAKTDLTAIRKMVDEKRNLSPSMVSTHMTSAMLHAFELSRATYDGHAVAASVLTTLFRMWDPSTPAEIMPAGRVQKSEVLNQLMGNLGLFLAAQNMAKEEPESMTVAFDDEEMVSTILPLFQDAISNSATFKLRLVPDVVDFIGKRTSYDGYAAPSHTILYEGYDVAGTMEAFTPVRQLRKADGRFLVPQNEVTASLNKLLAPIAAHMDVADMVDRRAQSYDLAAAESQGHDNGVEVFLAFPSLIERELSLATEPGLLRRFIAGEELPEFNPLTDGAADVAGTIQAEFAALRYDYYALVTHLAMARLDGDSAFVVSMTSDTTPQNIALAWEGRTVYRHPLGESAILHGQITTAEPIEALVYRQDFANTKELKTHLVDLKSHERNVHLWPWERASRKLDFTSIYTARINNRDYSVAVRENELLGLGVHRSNLYYLVPRNVASVVRLWSEWIASEHEFIRSKTVSRKSDPLVKDAYTGLLMQTGIGLVQMLSSIGTTGVGGRVNSLVRRRLADEMYKNDDVDSASTLVVGLQAARLNVWSGLVTLSLLGLLSDADVTFIFNLIKETKAMPMFVNSAVVKHT